MTTASDRPSVVDSSAWLEYFFGNPAATHFRPPIDKVERLVVPSIVIVEVCRRILQRRPVSDALLAAERMSRGRVVELDAELAVRAAQLGIEHRLPLADSIIFATAERHGAVIWTQDADFQHLPNVRYFPKVAPATGAPP
ncbi:MAG: type II toxin-antitoxin system VapC family toxin [Thermoanaerobaculia bacterium]|nr:type II toxin-antitoxin system VapC family toxin [Thermoanaerobaculia bacterium]